eukprot:5168140-Pleurochrysis_carterae.AAC.1
MVQVRDSAGAETFSLPATQLLDRSDAALAGVLFYDNRRGAAVPSMRVGREQALLSPCRGEPLARAVALAVGGDDPQE